MNEVRKNSARTRWASLGISVGLVAITATSVLGQLSDVTQTPNTANAGIHKSYDEQVGIGRGDVSTPDSSMFIIKRDPYRAVRRGRQIFQRKFTHAQGVGPRTQDGVGDIESDASIVAGLADSCASCHGRPRGAAGFGGDVFTRPDSRDAPHLFGLGLQEMLADEITKELRQIRDDAVDAAKASGVPETRALTSKGIEYGAITANPDGSVDTSSVEGVNADLRVRPFFAEGSTISIREFIVGAFNAEMGLESADPDMLAASGGADVVTPSGMMLSGSIDAIDAPPAISDADDPDADGVVDEIPTSNTDYMEFYLLNYFKAGRYQKTREARMGRAILAQVGCTECHIPNLLIESDRRVADVATDFDPTEPGFNRLFATASTRFDAVDDGSGYPTLKVPQGDSFLVERIFANFKRHDLGPDFHERNFDGTTTTHFMTEPLWGVGSTAPYGHDGRSINLVEVILRHGGEAQASRDSFEQLSFAQRSRVLQFLNSLVLFPPDDTASNLNPGDPATPGFPQHGHGSINLGALFNDPTEGE